MQANETTASKSSITTAVAPTIDSRPVTIFLRRVRIAAPMTNTMTPSDAAAKAAMIGIEI